MRNLMLSLSLTTMLLASCATTGLAPQAGRIEVTDTACKWVVPIYIANTDKLTPETSRQILAHNKAWQSACAGSVLQPPQIERK
jgi:hypothetical protein